MLLFLSCSWLVAYAQPKYPDHPLSQNLREASRLNRMGEINKSRALLEQTLIQAEKTGNPELVAVTRLEILRRLDRNNPQDSLDKRLDTLLEYCQHNGLTGVQVEAMTIKVTQILETRAFRPAMALCDEAIALARPLGDKRLDGLCLMTKAWTFYFTQNDSKSSLRYYYEAIAVLETAGDTSLLIEAILRAADDETDEAKIQSLLRRSAALSDAYPSVWARLRVLYFSARNAPVGEGIPLLQEALKLSRKFSRPAQTQNLLLNLCEKYHERKDYKHALAYLDTALIVFQPPYDIELYYYRIYRDMGEYKKAVEAMERFQKFEDERKNSDLKSSVAEWETRMNTREKEWEVEQKQQELSSQRTLNFLLGVILLIAVLAVGGVLYAFRQRGKALKLLASQNDTIRQQTEELKSLEQLKSRFFSNVSHELRTPLTLILAPIATVLKSGEWSERNANLLQKARQSGQDLLKLVGSILDLSKLEAGKMKTHSEPTLLLRFLKRNVAAFDSHAEQQAIHLDFESNIQEDVRLELDREKLKTVVHNLLSNALKFTPAGGSVAVKVDELPHDIRLSVVDTGRGIHTDEVAKVFDRFYQASRPLPGQKEAAAEGGTGIGLALCREFAGLMGGKVWAESELGKGSTFYFEFPKIVAAPGVEHEDTTEKETHIPSEAKPAPVSTTQRKVQQRNLRTGAPAILLVEDNHSLREYIENILSPHFQVITAENGQAALQYLREQTVRPDLILSDVMMPVMDGFQLLETLKRDEHLRTIPVVMLTARADMQDKLRALRIGVDDYLLKPFDEEELLTRINNLLERRRERVDFVQQTEPTDEEDGVAASDDLSPVAAEWLEQMETLVRSEVQNDLLAVNWLSQKMFVSERQLQRRIRILTGLSPNQYIREVRLQEARRLLETREAGSVKEAAYAVSFKDEKYFSQLFRERFGKTPSSIF